MRGNRLLSGAFRVRCRPEEGESYAVPTNRGMSTTGVSRSLSRRNYIECVTQGRHSVWLCYRSGVVVDQEFGYCVVISLRFREDT